MESLAYSTSKQVDPSPLENVYQFSCGCTDIFSKNVLSTNDETYKNLKNLIKLEGMIEEGVKKGTYKKQKIQP